MRGTRLLAGLVFAMAMGSAAKAVAEEAASGVQEEVQMSSVRSLPAVARNDGLSRLLSGRRSVRHFEARPLTDEELARLCWATQGIREPGRVFRTAPSAGATFPLDLYVALPEGVFRYDPVRHALEEHLRGDVRAPLRRAALDQAWVERAPAVFVFAATLDRIRPRYRDRAERYTLIEVGHAAQNLLLQATELGLGGVPVGAFDDAEVQSVLRLPMDQTVYYLVPVGVPSKGAAR